MAKWGKGAADAEALREMNADDLLDALGLMRKSEETGWLVPAIGGLGLGLLAGIALGLAFAPKRGADLRSDVAGKLKNKDFAGLADVARGTVGATSTGTASSSGTVPPPSGRGGSTVI